MRGMKDTRLRARTTRLGMLAIMEEKVNSVTILTQVLLPSYLVWRVGHVTYIVSYCRHRRPPSLIVMVPRFGVHFAS
jgi:hypothetical protein